MKKTFRINRPDPVYRGHSFGPNNAIAAPKNTNYVYQALPGADRYDKLFFKDSNIILGRLSQELYSSKDYKQPAYTFAPQLSQPLLDSGDSIKAAARTSAFSFPYFNEVYTINSRPAETKVLENIVAEYYNDRSSDLISAVRDDNIKLKRLSFETSNYISPEKDQYLRVLSKCFNIIKEHNIAHPIDIIPYVGRDLNTISAIVMRPIIDKTLLVFAYEHLKEYVNNKVAMAVKTGRANPVTMQDYRPKDIARIYNDINMINHQLKYIPVYKPLLTQLRTLRTYKAYEHGLNDIENMLLFIDAYFPELKNNDAIYKTIPKLGVMTGNLNGRIWNFLLEGLPIDQEKFLDILHCKYLKDDLTIDFSKVISPLLNCPALQTLANSYALFASVEEFDFTESISVDLRQVNDVVIDQIPIEYASMFDDRAVFESLNMHTFGDSVNLRPNWFNGWEDDNQGNPEMFVAKNSFSMNSIPINDGIFSKKDFKGEDLQVSNTATFSPILNKSLRAAIVTHDVKLYKFSLGVFDIEASISISSHHTRYSMNVLPSTLKTTLDKFFDKGMQIYLHPTVRYALFKQLPFSQQPTTALDDLVIFNSEGSVETATVSTREENLAKTMNAEKNESDVQPVDVTSDETSENKG